MLVAGVAVAGQGLAGNSGLSTQFFCEPEPAPVAQMIKDLPAMWETQAQALGWEDPPEEGMATHSSILP